MSIFYGFTDKIKANIGLLTNTAINNTPYTSWDNEAWDDSRNVEYNHARRYYSGAYSLPTQLIQKIHKYLYGSLLKLKVSYIRPDDINNRDFNELCYNMFWANNPDREGSDLRLYFIPTGKQKLIQAEQTVSTEFKAILQERELQGLEAGLILDRTHYIRAYNIPKTNNEDHTTVILTSNLTDAFMDRIFALYPQLVNAKLPELNQENASENDKNLYEVKKKYFDCYKAFWGDCYANREELSQDSKLKIKEFMISLEQYIKEKPIDYTAFKTKVEKTLGTRLYNTYKNTETSIQNDITQYSASLQQLYARLKDIQYKLMTYTPKDLSWDSFFDFINKSKNINIIDVNQNELLIQINTTLNYFDQNDYRILRKNPSSYMHSADPFKDWLIVQLFEKCTYSLKVQAIFKIIAAEYNSSGVDIQYIKANTLLTEFPNPHMYYFNCWSAARNEFYKAITNQNFELALSQLIAATAQLTLRDNAVTSRFISKFLGDSEIPPEKIHFIENSTGETRTISDLKTIYDAIKE